MNHGKGFAVSIAVALLALVFGTVAFAEEPPKPKTYNVGDKLDEIVLTDMAGNAVDFKPGEGVSAITIFNTACSACQSELTLLSNIKAQKKSLEVLAICVDANAKESLPKFLSLYKGYDKFKFYQDTEFKLSEKLGFSFSPGLILAGKDGTIIMKKGGYSPGTDVELITKAVLGAK